MADSLRDSSRRLALMKHHEKSYKELREIIQRDLSAASGLPSTESGKIEAQKLLGEVDACHQLCAHHDEIRKLKKDWVDSEAKRVAHSLMTLPTAVSYYGQLVASILEDEDGLTADEIAGFCEEFSVMDGASFTKLLSDLCRERIIEARRGKENETERYWLRMPLLKNGVWTVEYLRRYFDSMPKSSRPYNAAKILAVFALFERSKEPLSEWELMQRINSGEPSGMNAGFNLPISSSFDLCLYELEQYGLIKKAFMSSGTPDWAEVFITGSEGYGVPVQYYSPAYLGERDENEM